MEQSPGGELAQKMREMLRRIEPMLGFKVKVAERTGRALRSRFPLSSLWDGVKCGRTDCPTCNQRIEDLPPCTRSGLVYESVCADCNPSVKAKGGLRTVETTSPSLYVGESSRTIYERSREHLAGAKKKQKNNHMVKHLELSHEGRGKPDFVFKVVKFHRTALARQVAEAVRIRRRGGEGAVLNSKGEFSRCHIPRLRVEEEDPEVEKAALEMDQETKELLLSQDQDWEDLRVNELGGLALSGPMVSPNKRVGKKDSISVGNRRKKSCHIGGLPHLDTSKCH